MNYCAMGDAAMEGKSPTFQLHKTHKIYLVIDDNILYNTLSIIYYQLCRVMEWYTSGLPLFGHYIFPIIQTNTIPIATIWDLFYTPITTVANSTLEDGGVAVDTSLSWIQHLLIVAVLKLCVHIVFNAIY